MYSFGRTAPTGLGEITQKRGCWEGEVHTPEAWAANLEKWRQRGLGKRPSGQNSPTRVQTATLLLRRVRVSRSDSIRLKMDAIS